MTKSKKKDINILLVCLIIVLLMFGCKPTSSSSSSSDDSSDPCVAGATCDDISGYWSYSGYVVGNCGDPNYWEYDTFTITQSPDDCSFSLTTGNPDRSGTGTVDGSTVCLNSTSYPDSGGTSKIAKTTLTHSFGTVTGTSSWTWSDGTDS